MPIFEFKCNNCGKQHEHLMRLKEEHSDCPHCGSNDLVKLFSQTAPPQFKGTGFYATDYKKKFSGGDDE